MSDVLSVRANRNKHLQLAIHTESVRVDVDWKDCTHPQTTRAFSLLWRDSILMEIHLSV